VSFQRQILLLVFQTSSSSDQLHLCQQFLDLIRIKMSQSLSQL